MGDFNIDFRKSDKRCKDLISVTKAFKYSY